MLLLLLLLLEYWSSNKLLPAKLCETVDAHLNFTQLASTVRLAMFGESVCQCTMGTGCARENNGHSYIMIIIKKAKRLVLPALSHMWHCRTGHMRLHEY